MRHGSEIGHGGKSRCPVRFTRGMGKISQQLHCTPLLLGGAGVALALSACTAGESQPEPVDPETADIGTWSKAVLGEHDGMSLAGTSVGGPESSGTFYDLKSGWYRVTLACAGGDGNMVVSIAADGESVSDGTTGCDVPAVRAHIQLMADADELEIQVAGSGGQMLWTVGLEETTEPAPVPSG